MPPSYIAPPFLRSALSILLLAAASTGWCQPARARTGPPSLADSELSAPAANPVILNGPRRAAPFRVAREPFALPVNQRLSSAPRGVVVGGVAGGLVVGAAGFALGVAIDNIERGGPTHFGTATLVATAGGAATGALLGAGIGWLLGR